MGGGAGHQVSADIARQRGQDLVKMLGRVKYFGEPLDVQAVLDLIDSADVEQVDNNGLTVLMLAASIGNRAIVAALLKRGARIDVANKHTRTTALYYAANGGYTDIVALLLDQGAGINGVVGCSGSTALHIAADNGHADTVRYLLERHADVKAADVNGETALHLAASDRLYVGGGYAKVVTMLLDHAADIEAVDKRGYTPLILAVGSRVKDSEEIVSILIDRGADVRSKGASRHTPLVMAAHIGDISRFMMLVDRGADLKADLNRSLWHALFEKGRVELVTKLLDWGADIGGKVHRCRDSQIAAGSGRQRACA